VSSFRPLWDNVRISLLNTRLVAGRILWPPRWINRLPAPGGQWQSRHLGRLAGWRFFVNLIGWVGRAPVYVAMVGMSLFYLLMASGHRRGLMAYLRRRDPTARATALWLRAWRTFFSFACSLVDRFALLGSGPGEFELIHENTDAALEAVKKGGVIILTAHMGNPDLGAGALQASADAKPVTIVQYQTGSDPYVVLMHELLGDNAPSIIALGDNDDMASMQVVRALRRGEIVAIKADRVVDNRTRSVQLLGDSANLPSGPFLLAAIAKVPVFVMGCFKEGSGTYRVVTTEPRTLRFTGRGSQRDADVQGWMDEFAAVLAGWADRWPLQWYNFHDPWR
jgi:predicted LPLAT superfamily acyltransferase